MKLSPSPLFPLGYRPGLDGLRAVAILMVIAYHMRLLKGGFLGVDVFFALSGFLITSILLEEWEANGAISLKRFYARRALRLAPALCVFVLVIYALTHWVWPTLSGLLRPHWAWAALLYVSDLLIAYGREYPLGLVSICWSLGIEEQFYLVWPLTLRALLRRGVGLPALTKLLFAAIAAVGVFRQLLVWRLSGDPQLWLRVYFAPDTRADALLVGCLLSVVLRSRGAASQWPRGTRAAVGLGAVVLSYLAATLEIQDFVNQPVLFTLAAVVSVLLVLGVVAGGPWDRVLRAPVLVWIGRLSYSLYLWHMPPLGLRAPGGRVTQLALLLAFAGVSYYLVERPFLSLKARLAAVKASEGGLVA